MTECRWFGRALGHSSPAQLRLPLCVEVHVIASQLFSGRDVAQRHCRNGRSSAARSAGVRLRRMVHEARVVAAQDPLRRLLVHIREPAQVRPGFGWQRGELSRAELPIKPRLKPPDRRAAGKGVHGKHTEPVNGAGRDASADEDHGMARIRVSRFEPLNGDWSAEPLLGANLSSRNEPGRSPALLLRGSSRRNRSRTGTMNRSAPVLGRRNGRCNEDLGTGCCRRTFGPRCARGRAHSVRI